MTLPEPIPHTEAQARLLAMAEPLGTETLATAEAAGRYLTATLHARRSQPAADLSAMDGYAVCENDLEGPWQVVGESAAGHPFGGALQAGQAVRISTGALMPEGGDAVLIQENAVRNGDTLSLSGEDGPTKRHIRRKGFDFKAGDALLEAGQRVGPAQIALALSGGLASLPVDRLPRVAVIDCGDELSADPQSCQPHQLPASNGAMLLAMVRGEVAECVQIGPVPDEPAALQNALDQAGDVDVIVTSGGASVGDHDLIRPALQSWGAKLGFWRVAMKPGKPLLVAQKGRQIVLGLPGNPVSAFVTAHIFLLPILRRLAGAEKPLPPVTMLPLGVAMPQVGKRAEFVRGQMGPDGVVPLGEQDSSALLSLSSAEMLIVRLRGATAAKQGEMVPAHWLHNG